MIALSIMIFTSTVSVLSGLGTAPASFVGGEGFVISERTAPTIFSSHVDADIDEALLRSPNITGASPEVFAFASYDDESFVIRGVDLQRFVGVIPDDWEYVAYGDPEGGNLTWAAVGARLLERLGTHLPHTIPIVGSYQSRMTFLEVVGSFSTGTSMDDEMFVSLETARFLSGMPDDMVSIIRVATTDPEWLGDILSPESARFTLFDLHASEAYVAVGEPVTADVTVRNWGAAPGEVSVYMEFRTIPAGTVAFATTSMTLGPMEERSVTLTHAPASIENYTVRASLLGDLPVTLTTSFQAVRPYLRIAAPSTVLAGSEFNVTITTHSGIPAAGALVNFAGVDKIADDGGTVSFVEATEGVRAMLANLSGFSNGSWLVSVVDPSSIPNAFLPEIKEFSLYPTSMREDEDAVGRLVLVNNGLAPGTVTEEVLVDQGLYYLLVVPVPSLGVETVEFTISDISPGSHTVQVSTWAVGLEVVPWYADEPDLVEIIVRYGGSSSLSSASSIPIYQAAKISEGNVAVALFAVGSISGLLAFLAIVSVFSKEIHEGRRRLGVLKTIGASRADIRNMVLPQALETGLGGAAIGIGLGVIIADWISKSGQLFVFGHEIRLELDASLLVLTLISAIAISVVSALASAMIAVRETAISAIRNLEQEPGEPIDVNELLGDD